jgi:UDP-GlcNAc3NAcA epimerase
MKVLSIVGARPQFIKAAVLSPEFAASGIEEVLVHTGQHYDHNMSQIFFDGLKLKQPDHYLGVGSASHATQTAAMMARLEPILAAVSPDWVLVYGDTNSTLAGSLVAAKQNVPLAHVEAGLRSFDRTMPEEINRVVSNHVATALFAPTRTAFENLIRESLTRGVYLVGDLMVDLVRSVAVTLPTRPPILERFGLSPGEYGVVTVHRVANTEDHGAFRNIMTALRRLTFPVVFPVHPRTTTLFNEIGEGAGNVIGCEPLAYMDLVALQANARVVITDSGGCRRRPGLCVYPV